MHGIETKPYEAVPQFNVTIIDNNLGHSEPKLVPPPTSTVTPTKNPFNFTLHLDQSKIQSDSKDIVYDLTDNAIMRSTGPPTTTEPAAAKVILESNTSTASTISVHKRHHRRRRQGRLVFENTTLII